ncbi:hypothetical protein V5799_011672, partial [Amblyomma americanum]
PSQRPRHQTPGDPLEREALRVQGVRKGCQTEAAPHQPPADPLEEETSRVHRLRTALQTRL